VRGQVGHTVLGIGLGGTSTHFAHQHTILSTGFEGASTHIAVIQKHIFMHKFRPKYA